MCQFQQILQNDDGIGTGGILLFKGIQSRFNVAFHHLFIQTDNGGAVGQSDHRADEFRRNGSAAVRDRLIQ